VKRGGILLIVGHAAPDSWQPPRPEVHLPTAPEVLRSLELAPTGWEVESMEEFEREQATPEGEAGKRRDNILCLRRSGTAAGGPASAWENHEAVADGCATISWRARPRPLVARLGVGGAPVVPV